MTQVAEPPPSQMTRRFSPKKLATWLRRQSRNEAWLAGELDVREQTVKNWLAGRNEPGLTPYLDLVDLLHRLKAAEDDILDKT